ncbi:MAG: hypothetical protein QNJ55_21235 [Xenococcus sp. MO_188.B8]|nr:hypothetical protein [Xenococcus sp. MO_188.B8]
MSTVAETTTTSGLDTMDSKTNGNLVQNSESASVQTVEVPNTKDYSHNGHSDQQTQTLISTTTEKVSEPITSILEIGSRVANNDPEKKSYNWHGTIVGFSKDGAEISWDERKGMQGGQVLWHRLSELRPL